MEMLDSILHAGPVAWAVMSLLVAFSVTSWAITFSKYRELSKAEASSLEFIDLFWKLKRFDELFEVSKRYSHSPVAQVFRRGYQELVHLKGNEESPSGHGVSASGIDSVEHALRRATLSEMSALERMVPFLATVGSTSPFIGLFGTVVGIMASFHEIGLKGSASLATVAPGISEALIATAAGLLAAIPAVIAYNYFSVRIRAVNTEMVSFSSDFLSIVRRHFL